MEFTSPCTIQLRSKLSEPEKAEIRRRWAIRDTRKSLAMEFHCRPSLIESTVANRQDKRRWNETYKAKKKKRMTEEEKAKQCPMFIPLKTEHYENFEKRTKTEEFRPYGARWNEDACRIGRRVTLSKGYGKKHRLSGTITGFRIVEDPTTLPGWKDCYGDRKCKGCAVRIALDN